VSPKVRRTRVLLHERDINDDSRTPPDYPSPTGSLSDFERNGDKLPSWNIRGTSSRDETFDDLCRQLDATGEGTLVAAQVGKLFQL
jgi:hypothetical protein